MKSVRILAGILSALAGSTALAVCSPSDVTLADPATFTVKRCWTASELGLPLPLGGLLFSADGVTLYAVGAADAGSSAIHALPVTRSGAGEVIDLAPSNASFPGSSPGPDAGLDAGLERGPGGTIFTTYFGVDPSFSEVTLLGERPVGVGGAETQFDLSTLTGLTQSPAGLTFSPVRIDPGTGFGLLQIGLALGRVDDLTLIPSTPGLFTPGTRTPFVTVMPGGLGAIQYVPGTVLGGDLLYTSVDDASVRRVHIDPTTGLPIDAGTMQPMQGTANPVDAVFASGFAPPPIGLEFDAGTGDLFVATYDASADNAIYQIGGFSAGGPSTSTTTTTTLPGGCEPGASFGSIACRLGALDTLVNGAGDLGKLGTGLHRSVDRTRQRSADAERLFAEGHTRGAKRALGKAIRAMAGFRTRLGTRAARRLLTSETRSSLGSLGGGIMTDLRSLRTLG